MKAIIVNEFGGPEVMHLVDISDPEPQAGQVLVQIKAAGVNPVDTYIRSGIYGSAVPYTPGADGAGIVEAIGDDVTKVKPGDRVYIGFSVTGTYAEKTLCNENQVYPLPDRLSFSQGAGINVTYATAYRALMQRAKGIPGETILVHGATGGVGTAAVQIAKAYGFRVVATGGTDKGRTMISQQGADVVVDHLEEGYLQKALDLSGVTGFDIVLEMLANVNLQKDLEHLALNGRVVVIGNRGTIEINPRETMRRDAAVIGMTLMNADEKTTASIHSALIAGFATGTLSPVIGKEIPLQEATRAHQEILQPGSFGKIVLIP